VVSRYPSAARILQPIDFNDAEIEHPISTDAVARISETNKTEKQIKKDEEVLKKIKRMFYRTAGDFYAPKPPSNDQVEIIGYIYKRPSSKLPKDD
jgi:hypothetical protein